LNLFYSTMKDNWPKNVFQNKDIRFPSDTVANITICAQIFFHYTIAPSD